MALRSHRERPKFGLYLMALYHITEVQHGKSIIPFRVVFERLGTVFHLKKDECWELLFIYRDLGFIEIVGYHGIRVNFDRLRLFGINPYKFKK